MAVRARLERSGWVPVAIATGFGYYVLAALMWQIDPTWGSAFWPAAGLTFSVLVRSERAWWPWILAAVFVAESSANVQFGTSRALAVWGAIANTAEALVGAALFLAATRRRRVNDLSSFGWLIGVGAAIGPAIGAVFGGLLAVSGPEPLTRWLRWFVGDAVGVVAVAPVLLADRSPVRRWKWPEVLALGGAVAAASGLLFSSQGTFREVGPYLAVPVLLWAALRFGVIGAAIASTLVAVSVHAATATGHGAFIVGGSPRLVIAQIYLGVIVVSVLTVALLTEDVARRRRKEQELLRRVLHDPLTGLANRAMLEIRFAERGLGGVIVVDLDGFKKVNDSLGHAAGDTVLIETSERLRSASRPEDLVARLGGDEFVVVLSGGVTAEALEATADRLAEAVSQPIQAPTGEIQIGASVGAALGADGVEAAELLAAADRRMYQRKRSLQSEIVLPRGTPARAAGSLGLPSAGASQT